MGHINQLVKWFIQDFTESQIKRITIKCKDQKMYFALFPINNNFLTEKP